MYSDIDMSLVKREWEKASENRDQYTVDFKDLDTIVDGAPLHRQSGAPFVADTTVPGLVHAIPRAAIQQLPVFGVQINGTKNSLYAQVGTYLLRRAVFNEDTFGKGILSTLQLGTEQAVSHGYAPFMTVTGTMFDEFGTSMRLLHYSNVSQEPGVQSDNEAGYFYVEADLPKSRVRKIYNNALDNEGTTWDADALAELLEMEPAGDDYSAYQPATRGQIKQNTGTYKFITRYEVGAPGKFITFCPQLEDKPLRVLMNKSKFGYPRVQYLVIDPAPLTPYGLSRVRLASPHVNLMNAYYQNVMSLLLINSKPPVFKRGRFNGPTPLKNGVTWEAIDADAKIELMTLDNGTLQQFVPMAKQIVAQMQNIMGAPQGNVGGDQNALGYSKTSNGVKMQQNVQDLAGQQLTNILENFLRQYALVALDTYICEQSGETELILDDEAKNNINRVAEAEFVPSVDPMTGQPTVFTPPVGADNKITIVWETFYDFIKDWKIDIELSISKNELEEKKRGDLQDTLTVMEQNDKGDNPAKTRKIDELEDMLIEDSVPETNPIGFGAAPAQTVAAPLPTGAQQ